MAEEGIVRRRVPVLAMMFFAISPAWAQSPPPPDQAEQIRILLERVEQLEKRVVELETKPAAAAGVTVQAANVAAVAKPEMAQATPPPWPAHQHETAEQQTPYGLTEMQHPSHQMRGFGDMALTPSDHEGT